ncbi:mitochondrial antiviral-signaling protein [Chanos chanos]|uniref:Mitochondrial antiviral-signaling protein n=1 Tax=Chanos chanos TaxID=29144 RepID=A0A6J2V225_CHACN|nr:flocculation protein FLO11-like [Chanos chanos]
MAYVNDKLYQNVVRPKMARLASVVRVREILPHLTCLTLSDQEEIEAKRETVGNYNAMQLLLDNLRRRENWPDVFIRALYECEHHELADEISGAYNALTGRTNQRAAASDPTPAPAAPSATVTTATVHAAPASTLPLPAPSQQNPPLQAVAPRSEPLPDVASPVAPPSAASQAPAPLPPEPTPPQESVPQAVAAPSLLQTTTPQISAPSTASQSQTDAPSSQVAANDPVSVPQVVTPPSSVPEASAPSLDAAPEQTAPLDSDPHATTPPPVSTLQNQSSIEVSETPKPGEAAEIHQPQLNSDIPAGPPVAPASTNAQPQSTNLPSATAPAQTTDFQEEDSLPVAVPETHSSVSHPIQDTNPPEKDSSEHQEPEESSDPTMYQPVESEHQNQESNASTIQDTTDAAVGPVPTCVAPAGAEGMVSEEEEEFSKPGTLQSMPAQRETAHTVAPLEPVTEEPCSVTSDDLEISRSTVTMQTCQDTVRTPPVVDENPEAAEEPVPDFNSKIGASGDAASDSVTTHEATLTPCQENGLGGDRLSSLNQPIEDHYESVCQSLQSETLVNIVQVSEEPSIQNLDGQPLSNLVNDVHVSKEVHAVNHDSHAENVIDQDVSIVPDDQSPPDLGNIDHVNQQALPVVDPPAHGESAVVSSLEPKVTGLNVPMPEPNANPQKELQSIQEQREAVMNEGENRQLQPNHYLIAAGAVGVALLMAWKLKN